MLSSINSRLYRHSQQTYLLVSASIPKHKHSSQQYSNAPVILPPHHPCQLLPVFFAILTSDCKRSNRFIFFYRNSRRPNTDVDHYNNIDNSSATITPNLFKSIHHKKEILIGPVRYSFTADNATRRA